MMDTNLDAYKTFVEIFKGYLDTALTANIWFYTITGAIVANYLSHREKRHYLRFSLVVPFIFGCALTFLSFKGIVQASYLEDKVREIAIGLKIEGAPPVEILRGFLWTTGLAGGLICVGLIGLFIWGRHPMFDDMGQSSASK